jgi:glycosyltransferase involved in cell wall biosynthesis
MADPSQIRTLEVIPSLSPAFGGPVEVVLNLTRGLRALGVDAQIATTNDNMPGKLDVPLNQKVDYQGVPTYFFSRAPIRLKEFLFSGDLSWWLWQNIKNYDFVTAHCLWSYGPDVLAIMARLQGRPYAMRTMGQLAPWSLSQGNLKKSIYSMLIEKPNLKAATFIHCTAEAEAQDVLNFGIETPRIVIPLGVSPPPPLPNAKQQLRTRFSIPEDVPIVLFMSRIHPKKRLDLLIEVLGKLRLQKQPFHLVVAGSGVHEYAESLRQLVNEFQIEAQTTFTGFVIGEDKNLILQGSDIFVLPTYSENFGIVLAEAMVVGLPIITTPGVNISPEIAKAKAGIIVQNDTDLQVAISQLLQSPQLRSQMGENGKLLALERYSWPSIAKQFVEIYNEIINEKAPYLVRHFT